jgi:UDP-N-acetylmuramoyl-L-alanyl-D-glutamate--2,6-diaminopimelate ligase
MTLDELIGPDATFPAHAAATPIAGLTADSRQVEPGYLFAALPGVNTDGTRFIADALARGAAAILVPDGVHPETSAPVIADADPRRLLALIAARFFHTQPDTVVAVTGTNGKTSVASFVRQLWAAQGYEAASLGTVGVVTPSGRKDLRHTTPDPIELHSILAALAKDGITHLALEASSHGLQQRRIDGVRLAAGAFTNISRDHLDYHATFEDYFAQKLRLFSTLLAPGAAAVIDMDGEASARVADEARARRLDVITVGRAGETLRLVSDDVDSFAQVLGIEHDGKRHTVRLPLVGGFQAANALVAAGLVMATGARAEDVLPNLAILQGARGRLDLAGTSPAGSPIFVDYAHTPDALAKALEALRPYVRNRLLVVFGCGGDRDKGKRPEMGAASVAKADIAIVTDDNPRNEDPSEIRREILAGAPGAIEIGNRAEAIAEAVAMLEKGDVLLVAGKGHETGQTVGTTVIPFSDHEAVSAALNSEAKLG